MVIAFRISSSVEDSNFTSISKEPIVPFTSLTVSNLSNSSIIDLCFPDSQVSKIKVTTNFMTITLKNYYLRFVILFYDSCQLACFLRISFTCGLKVRDLLKPSQAKPGQARPSQAKPGQAHKTRDRPTYLRIILQK